MECVSEKCCSLDWRQEAAVSISLMEAAIGFEPMNRGFADLCLTTWLRRQNFIILRLLQKSKMSFPKCLIGNPVLVKSMPYGCPTEPFGHDKVIKRKFCKSLPCLNLSSVDS